MARWTASRGELAMAALLAAAARSARRDEDVLEPFVPAEVAASRDELCTRLKAAEPAWRASLLRWLEGRAAAGGVALARARPRHSADVEYEVLGPDRRDVHFDDLVRRHGRVVAFHGSPLPNWWRILHVGLKNVSYTRRMATGALYGEGAYLATEADFAREFADSASLAWPEGAAELGLGASMQCVGVFEVADVPETVRRPRAPGTTGEGGVPEGYVVVGEGAHVRLVRLLLWRGTRATAAALPAALAGDRPLPAAGWLSRAWSSVPAPAVYVALLLALILARADTRRTAYMALTGRVV